MKVDSPLVTAVMVTGMHPERVPMARVAVRCFLNQSYANKELLIINHGESLGIDHPLVREMVIDRLSLGAMRNEGLRGAMGDWIIQWDDDDFHHQHRILFQMAHRPVYEQSDGIPDSRAVVLRKQMRVSLTKGDAFNVEDTNGIAGTILHSTRGMTAILYPDMEQGEDSAFLQMFENVVVLDNDSDVWPGPALYVRFYHGRNTCDEAHIMGDQGSSFTHKWQMNRDEIEYLKTVVPHYGAQLQLREG
jgi:glycosyltransferase involved in cell wall biosynthesis